MSSNALCAHPCYGGGSVSPPPSCRTAAGRGLGGAEGAAVVEMCVVGYEAPQRRLRWSRSGARCCSRAVMGTGKCGRREGRCGHQMEGEAVALEEGGCRSLTSGGGGRSLPLRCSPQSYHLLRRQRQHGWRRCTSRGAGVGGGAAVALGSRSGGREDGGSRGEGGWASVYKGRGALTSAQHVPPTAVARRRGRLAKGGRWVGTAVL